MNRFLLALGCLSIVACSSNPGPITLTDTGPSGTPDAPVVGTDAPVGDPDAPPGGPCGSLAGATVPAPPLPAGCVPRCTTATGTAVSMCTTAACLQTALSSDATPPATLDIGGGMTQSINCLACFAIQQNSCAYDGCPTETTALLTCLQGGGACTAEQGAVQTCLMSSTAITMAFQTCMNTRAGACFGAAGFGPTFERRTLESEAFRSMDLSSHGAIASEWLDAR